MAKSSKFIQSIQGELEMQIRQGNNLIATGNVGSVDYKEVGADSKPLARVGLAVGKIDGSTTWVSCNFWQNNAKIAKTFNKGDTLLVAGFITTFKNNENKSYENLQVEYYSILGKSAGGYKAQGQPNKAELTPIVDDDLPF